MSLRSYQLVARVVFPLDNRAETVPLYIDAGAGARIVGRSAVTLEAGVTASFGTYFNSFPAAYWERESSVDTVRLTVHTSGTGQLLVRRSDAAAHAMTVNTVELVGATVELDLPVRGFEDGGVYWFELVAGDGGLCLESADWRTTGAAAGTATVGMTTFNRPVDCLAQLRQLAGEDALEAIVRRIVVVDQGDDSVSDQPGFAEVAARLGDRLHLVRQRNLGGSGGFSRAMAEALDADADDYVVLLDDDAISEPESLLRAVRFADAARSRILIGGGMLHLDNPGVLYTQSEQWDERVGWVRLNRPGAYDHDFSEVPFTRAPYFHALQRADFAGWWMCLIPITLLRERGLAWPLFIKGDDVEFGRRAAAAGVATVSVPGIAVWHLGWGGKAPTRSWEAYFLHRNRLIGELLHAPSPRPWRIVAHSFLGDVKPLLGLQYSGVRLRALAIEDLFDGPGALADRLDTRLAEVRALRARFPDAITVDPRDAVRARRSPGGAGALALALVRHLLLPVRRDGSPVRLSAVDADWTAFVQRDSAYVDTADGSATTLHRRSRRATWRALGRSSRLHTRLLLSWPRLRREYRAAAMLVTSRGSWERTFGRTPPA